MEQGYDKWHACITNDGDTYTWEDYPCKHFFFKGVHDGKSKLEKDSVTHLDITIQVDFETERKSTPYYKLEFGNALELRVFVDLEDNQTVITHKSLQDSERTIRFLDIKSSQADMTITIYVNNTSMTVYDSLSGMKTTLPMISEYPIMKRERKGISLKKIKYEKNIPQKPQEIADYDDQVTKMSLDKILKVRRIPKSISFL